MPKDEYKPFFQQAPLTKSAYTTRIATPNIVNNPVIYRHSARLENLKPNTAYVYAVGDSARTNMSDIFEFTTAPEEIAPFSFMYIGDTQDGPEQWRDMMRKAELIRPEYAFITDFHCRNRVNFSV